MNVVLSIYFDLTSVNILLELFLWLLNELEEVFDFFSIVFYAQHMRAHKDTVALQHSFYEVVSADENVRHSVKELKHRSLNPGLYAQHIDRWLSHFDPSQVSPVHLPLTLNLTTLLLGLI